MDGTNPGLKALSVKPLFDREQDVVPHSILYTCAHLASPNLPLTRMNQKDTSHLLYLLKLSFEAIGGRCWKSFLLSPHAASFLKFFTEFSTRVWKTSENLK